MWREASHLSRHQVPRLSNEGVELDERYYSALKSPTLTLNSNLVSPFLGPGRIT